MSASAPYVDLPPQTRASIELQPKACLRSRSCGCELLDNGCVWLCSYHEGFLDAEEIIGASTAAEIHEVQRCKHVDWWDMGPTGPWVTA